MRPSNDSGVVLGSVVDNGKIVGQARFRPCSAIGPGLAAGFQVASAITLQYYLNEITSQLASIEGAVDRIYEFLSETALAEIMNASRTSEDLAAILSGSGTLEPHDLTRLVNAQEAVSTAYLRDVKLTEKFCEQAAELSRRLDEVATTVGTPRLPHGLGQLKRDLLRFDDALPGSIETAARAVLSAEVRARLLLIEAAVETSDGAERGSVISTRAKAAIQEQALELRDMSQLFSCFPEPTIAVLGRLFVGDDKIREVIERFRDGTSWMTARVDRLATAFEQGIGAPIATMEIRPVNESEVEVLVLE
jgi:hypothetical protein